MSRRGRRALGLDLGEKRIGVAISDESGTIATPLTTIERGRDDVAELVRLAWEWEVVAVVVGLPTGLSGREGPQAAATRAFAEGLAAALGPQPPLRFWDERLTTAIAERVLREQKVRGEAKKGRRDALAAAVILQGYLDAHR